MTAAPLRSDRRRSLVTLAVWSVGFLAVVAVAAWQFGWLPTDEEAARVPAEDVEVELSDGSAVPFQPVDDPSASRSHAGWQDDVEFVAANREPAAPPAQREPQSAANPPDEQTDRDDHRRPRLWDHVRSTPADHGNWPPANAAPRYSSAAEPTGWLVDSRSQQPAVRSTQPDSPPRGPQHATSTSRPAPRYEPDRMTSAGPSGAAARPSPADRSNEYDTARRHPLGAVPHGGSIPDPGPAVRHRPSQIRYGRVEPAGYDERHAIQADGGDDHDPYSTTPNIRLAGVEIDTAGPTPMATQPAADMSLDPNHPAARELSEIDRLIAAGEIKEAHRRLSTLYWKQPDWRPLLEKRIGQTAESIYFSSLRHYMEPHVVEPGDQLGRIASRYKVSWQYLERLNNVPANRIRPGQRLKVIKGPFAARIDLSDFELTVHAHGWYVRRYRVGIGRDGSTPFGNFTAQEKLVNPTYYRPAAEGGGIVAADDPSNPLGEYWIGIGNSYGIHGTVDARSVGGAESRGCIRLLNVDVAELFDLLVPGSEVVIQP